MAENDLGEITGKLVAELGPDDLDRTLRDITTTAVLVLPDVNEASISITHSDGRLLTVAPTTDVLERVDATQYLLREGPCFSAAMDEVNVTCTHLAADERFPRYGPAAVEFGFRAQAGLALFHHETSRGALNLYSRRDGAFADLATVAPLFTHQSAMALRYALEIDNLRQAMESRSTIGRAVGVVMERYGLGQDRAFAFLARESQHRNVKLREVAARLLDTLEGESGQA